MLNTGGRSEGRLHPANVRIVANAGLVRIDLNHDGIADFALSNTWKSTSSEIFKNLWVQNLRPANETRAWLSGYSTSAWCAAALPRGTKVGPKGQFHVGPLPMPDDGFRGPKFCPWLHVRQAYLGLKFVTAIEAYPSPRVRSDYR
jgi:hypothetical protein